MPDIFGASGQFSIDALGAQNQNALNNAYGSGGFGGTVGQYAPYPSFGGPIDTGPAPSSGGGGGVPYQDLTARYWELMGGGSRGQPSSYSPQPSGGMFSGTGGGYFDPSIYSPAQVPKQPQLSQDWSSYFNQLTGPQQQQPQQQPTFNDRWGLWNQTYGNAPAWPNMQNLLGYKPISMSPQPWLPYYIPGANGLYSGDRGFEALMNPDRATRDYNVIDPDTSRWQFRNREGYGSGSDSRDQIASALMNQSQVRQGTS